MSSTHKIARVNGLLSTKVMKIAFTSIAVTVAVLISGCQTTEAANRVTVDFDHVTTLAINRAAAPYQEEGRRTPDFLSNLTYDEYRDIRFKTPQALWSEESLPFRVELFHPGYHFNKTVSVHEFTQTHEQRIRFATALFDYGQRPDLAAQIPRTLDYAGFRVRSQFNRTGVFDEFVAFLGASYFRAVGRGLQYGLSARGLAINMGAPAGEEFPEFVAFWLGKPVPGATDLTVYALLDSPSVAGAYEFIITPGATARFKVRARIILRKEVDVLGLAPFSSMFWFGENTLQPPPDFRPEVHDSDGLLTIANGEHSWRPLDNPPRIRVDVLPGDNLDLFGLVQRDRIYAHYQDIEAAYHLRPGAWVIPGRGMQAGHLRLLEITTRDEYMDNIALLWEPAEHPAPGEIFEFDYELHFGPHPLPSIGAVIATRTGKSIHNPELIEFVVDFASTQLGETAEVEPIEAIAQADGTEIVWQQVRKNPFNDSWRMTLRVRQPESPAGAHLSAHLSLHGNRLSETWKYRWTP